MLRIQNRHVEWPQHQIVIPGANAKDAENRRIPFDPQGRLAPILKRRAQLGLNAFVFGSPDGEFQDSFKTAWESLLLVAYGHETKRVKPGARVDRDEAAADRFALARSAARRRLPVLARRRRHPHHPVDARALRHQDDAAVPEHHRRGVAEGADRRLGTPAAVEGSRRITTTRRPASSRHRIVSHLSVGRQSRSRPIRNDGFFLGIWCALQDSNLRPPGS